MKNLSWLTRQSQPRPEFFFIQEVVTDSMCQALFSVLGTLLSKQKTLPTHAESIFQMCPLPRLIVHKGVTIMALGASA